jgi:hypothetical protein
MKYGMIRRLNPQDRNRTELRSATVENKVEILLAVMFEHPVGTDKRDVFRNCLCDGQAVGRVVVTGDEFQMRKSVEVFFLHIINRDVPFIDDVMKNIFRRFPPFGSDSAVLKKIFQAMFLWMLLLS